MVSTKIMMIPVDLSLGVSLFQTYKYSFVHHCRFWDYEKRPDKRVLISECLDMRGFTLISTVHVHVHQIIIIKFNY